MSKNHWSKLGAWEETWELEHLLHAFKDLSLALQNPCKAEHGSSHGYNSRTLVARWKVRVTTVSRGPWSKQPTTKKAWLKQGRERRWILGVVLWPPCVHPYLHTCLCTCTDIRTHHPHTYTQLVVPFSSDYRKVCIIPVCHSAEPTLPSHRWSQDFYRDTRRWQKLKSPKPAAAGIQTGFQPVGKTRKHNGKSARVLGLSQWWDLKTQSLWRAPKAVCTTGRAVVLCVCSC